MTPDEPAPDSLDGAIAEYLRRVDAGDTPDRAVFLAAHPSHADGLRSFFRDQDRFEPIVPVKVVESGQSQWLRSLTLPARKESSIIFGGYELLEEIARGGTGMHVWDATPL